MESITVAQKEEEDEIDESEITEDSEVTDPSMEAEIECSPSEPAWAESKSNSHAFSELTDLAIDESEIQSPTSRTRGSLAACFSNGVNRH
ncbi:hypothetical protein T459_35526 [Capsicum annuum]|uniref:Uncharacterized protein n=1 Tax=Capsicum annuum TaxID=4072 RepID=A0A2G2XJ27_CAPAN|nr:hypothetical protein T459_35526 [Capsicum annuum]